MSKLLIRRTSRRSIAILECQWNNLGRLFLGCDFRLLSLSDARENFKSLCRAQIRQSVSVLLGKKLLPLVIKEHVSAGCSSGEYQIVFNPLLPVRMTNFSLALDEKLAESQSV